MKLFIKEVLLYLLSFILLIMLVNLLSDPSNLFSKKNEEEISSHISSGQNVTYSTNVDERLLQELIIQKIHYTPTTLVLGSSRVMLVGLDYFNDLFFNSSVSAASLKDIIAIYNIYLSNDKAPSNLVIGIDPWMLNDNNGLNGWRSIKSYYDNYKAKETYSSSLTNSIYNYKQLLSLSYFQTSVLNILKKRFNIFKTPPVVPTAKWVNDTFTKRIDGTISYDKNYREVTSEIVNQKARDYLSSKKFS